VNDTQQSRFAQFHEVLNFVQIELVGASCNCQNWNFPFCEPAMEDKVMSMIEREITQEFSQFNSSFCNFADENDYPSLLPESHDL
jgi:hypothetical protein